MSMVIQITMGESDLVRVMGLGRHPELPDKTPPGRAMGVSVTLVDQHAHFSVGRCAGIPIRPIARIWFLVIVRRRTKVRR